MTRFPPLFLANWTYGTGCAQDIPVLWRIDGVVVTAAKCAHLVPLVTDCSVFWPTRYGRHGALVYWTDITPMGGECRWTFLSRNAVAHGIIEALLAEVAKYGTAHGQRAYGDWTRANLKGSAASLLTRLLRSIPAAERCHHCWLRR
jgi:hypothetical protein